MGKALERVAVTCGVVSFLLVLWTGFQLRNANNDLLEIQQQIPKCEMERVGGRVVVDFVGELTRDVELRDSLQLALVSGLSSSLEDIHSPVVKRMMADLSRHFLPQNLVTLLDNIAVANYSRTARIVQQFFHNASLAAYQESFSSRDKWELQDWGNRFEITSQAAGIVANTSFQSNLSIVSDGSQLGNFFSELQPFIEQTLGNTSMTKTFATNCLSLCMRVFEPKYIIHVDGDTEDVTEKVRKIVKFYFLNPCQILQTSTTYS